MERHDEPFLYFCVCLEFGPKWLIFAGSKWVFYNFDVHVTFQLSALLAEYTLDLAHVALMTL